MTIKVEDAISNLKNQMMRFAEGTEPDLALQMAIKALEDSRWIPVTERLPEESYDSVIGWDAYRERCVFVQFYNGRFQISGSNETFDIKYWMPMITPPYEGSEEG